MDDADRWADRVLDSNLTLAQKGRLMELYPLLREGLPLAQLLQEAPARQADGIVELRNAQNTPHASDRNTIIDLPRRAASRRMTEEDIDNSTT